MEYAPQPVIQSVQSSYKKTSIGRVVTLGIIGFLLGILVFSLINVQIPWLVASLGVAIVFGVLGYMWKVRVYSPLSMESLTTTEWMIWLIVSVVLTPFVSGTVAYYMYKHNNRYPVKWKRINIILLIGLVLNIFIWLAISRK